MKYKSIAPMLHNFGHSFMSGMNVVDGEPVVPLLGVTLRDAEQPRLEIHFPSRRIEPQAEYDATLRKSIGHWADWLPGHMVRHGVSSEALPELVLVVSLDASGVHCRVRATDDRGKDYLVDVNEHS